MLRLKGKGVCLPSTAKRMAKGYGGSLIIDQYIFAAICRNSTIPGRSILIYNAVYSCLNSTIRINQARTMNFSADFDGFMFCGILITTTVGKILISNLFAILGTVSGIIWNLEIAIYEAATIKIATCITKADRKSVV